MELCTGCTFMEQRSREATCQFWGVARKGGKRRERESRFRRNQACAPLHLGFPAPRTMRKRCLLWELPVRGILLQEQ